MNRQISLRTYQRPVQIRASRNPPHRRVRSRGKPPEANKPSFRADQILADASRELEFLDLARELRSIRHTPRAFGRLRRPDTIGAFVRNTKPTTRLTLVLLGGISILLPIMGMGFYLSCKRSIRIGNRRIPHRDFCLFESVILLIQNHDIMTRKIAELQENPVIILNTKSPSEDRRRIISQKREEFKQWRSFLVNARKLDELVRALILKMDSYGFNINVLAQQGYLDRADKLVSIMQRIMRNAPRTPNNQESCLN